MVRLTCTMRHLAQSAVMLCTLISNAVGFLQLCLRSPAALAAENLFLQKQLALYKERHVEPQRVTGGTRWTPVWLSHWFDWPSALAIVQGPVRARLSPAAAECSNPCDNRHFSSVSVCTESGSCANGIKLASERLLE